MPLKEQNGNSQGSHGSQPGWNVVTKHPKPEHKVPPKAQLSTPGAEHAAAALLGARAPSGALLTKTPTAGELQEMQAKMAKGQQMPMVTPRMPAHRVAVADADDDDDGIEDVKSALMSKDQLKKSLERRKKRKAALEAARS